MLGESNHWDPWAFLESNLPGVQVVEMDLPGRLQGCCDPEQGVIWLRAGLTEVERRSVLTYEIAQLRHGPVPTHPALAAAHKRDSEDWAARHLISPCDITRAFAECHTITEVAVWLGVDTQTVRARLRGLTDEEQDAVMLSIHHLHQRDAA